MSPFAEGVITPDGRFITSQERIRELEALNDTQAKNMTVFQERIRELERRLEEFTPEDIREMAYGTNALLEQRIQKAREILQAMIKSGSQLGPANMKRALDALEGK